MSDEVELWNEDHVEPSLDWVIKDAGGIYHSKNQTREKRGVEETFISRRCRRYRLMNPFRWHDRYLKLGRKAQYLSKIERKDADMTNLGDIRRHGARVEDGLEVDWLCEVDRCPLAYHDLLCH